MKLTLNRAARRKGGLRLEHLTFNLSGPIRTEELEGRKHLVVPCVMITEGVHNGNNGPGLYRAKDTARTVQSWDHMPVVLDHPPHGSARRKTYLNRRKVGIVLNTRWDDAKSKLRSEVWLDYNRTKTAEPRLIKRLEAGKKVEVSTGLYLNRARERGKFNGERYDWIAKDQTPDHLAILMDGEGACSIKDGGGLLQLNSKQKSVLIDLLKTVSNRDFSTKTRKKMASKGTAMPDGSYPIANEEDLKNAIQAIGRAKNRAAVMRHIKKRARALGLTSLLPDKWTTNKGRDMRKVKKSKTNPVREKKVRKLIANGGWTKKDKKFLTDMPVEQFKRLYEQAMVKNAVKKAAKDAGKGFKVEGDKKSKKKVLNRGKEMSEKDFLAKMPRSMREVYNQGKNALLTAKKRLIKVITSNENNVFSKEYLREQSIDQLEGLAALAQTNNEEDEDEGGYGGMFRRGYKPSYVGNVSGKRRVVNRDDEEEPGLKMPTLYPTKNKAKGKKNSKVRAA